MSTVIRAARTGDISTLGDVLRRAAWSNAGDRALLRDHPEYLEAPVAAVLEGRVLVALRGGTVVGFATVTFADDDAALDDLFVDPQWTRRGVGTSLVRAVGALALARGARHLVTIANPHALAFYRTVGFTDEHEVAVEGGRGIVTTLDLLP